MFKINVDTEKIGKLKIFKKFPQNMYDNVLAFILVYIYF